MTRRRWHFGHDWFSVLEIVFEWVDSQPAWLRPALLGAGLIWAFAISRGGLVVLPIVLVATAFANIGLAIRLLLCVVVIAPAGGFLGGLAYSALSPVAGRIGHAGRVLQHVAASFVYGLVLVFILDPLFSGAALSLPQRGDVVPNLVFAGIIGLLGGAALSVPAGTPGTPRKTNWAFVGGVILVAAVLALAMYVAGWTS